MQSLDIISVNLWQILISLANLTILFLLLKKFLYKPVTKMLEQRQAEIAAKARGDKIVEDAKAQAQGIIRQAQTDAELEKKRAESAIKTQIIDVSTALSEKMLEREINADDHKALIDDFIKKIGEDDDSDR